MSRESKRGDVVRQDVLLSCSASFQGEQCIPHRSRMWPIGGLYSSMKASVSYSPEENKFNGIFERNLYCKYSIAGLRNNESGP